MKTSMRVVITARDFAACESRAAELLQSAGHQVFDYSGRGLTSGSSEEEVILAAKEAEALIVGLEPCSERVLSHCRDLKLISRRGIGYDNIDVEACRRRGIAVSRTVGAVEGAVAEHVMAYILHFARRLDLQNMDMKRREWNRRMMPGAKNRVLGLVGFGGIGKEIARRAIPFGMKVVYFCRHPKKEWEKEFGVTYLPLKELLAASDYVSVNIPLTDETKGFINGERLSWMKRGSALINVARGGIVEEEALFEALKEGRLAGAGIDVFSREPCTDSPLADFENVVLTPHTAPYTEENFAEMNRRAAQNVIDFFEGQLKKENRLA